MFRLEHLRDCWTRTLLESWKSCWLTTLLDSDGHFAALQDDLLVSSTTCLDYWFLATYQEYAGLGLGDGDRAVPSQIWEAGAGGF